MAHRGHGSSHGHGAPQPGQHQVAYNLGLYPDPAPAVYRIRNRREDTRRMAEQPWPTSNVPFNNFQPTPILSDAVDVFLTINEAWNHVDWAASSRRLGSGSFGDVYLGLRPSENGKELAGRHWRAVKQIHILQMVAKMNPANPVDARAPIGNVQCPEGITSQIKFPRCIKHENVIRLMCKFAVEETKSVYLMSEYCDAGDLENERHHAGNFSEVLARYYFRQITAGLANIHSRGIAHRHMKPQNMLLKWRHDVEGKIVKISHFKLARIAWADAEGTTPIYGNTR